jgi:hypothetical protein
MKSRRPILFDVAHRSLRAPSTAGSAVSFAEMFANYESRV